MSPDELRDRIPLREMTFSASRSGGPGGQNVNKVSTKVELRFDVRNSSSLTEPEKEQILASLKNRISSDGELIIISQSERTQLLNKRKTISKFYKLVSGALTGKRERRATSPSKISKARRLEDKRKHSGIKKMRRESGISEDEI
jgi:ribosome-associated protein